jgi:hypothetical protein
VNESSSIIHKINKKRKRPFTKKRSNGLASVEKEDVWKEANEIGLKKRWRFGLRRRENNNGKPQDGKKKVLGRGFLQSDHFCSLMTRKKGFKERD